MEPFEARVEAPGRGPGRYRNFWCTTRHAGLHTGLPGSSTRYAGLCAGLPGSSTRHAGLCADLPGTAVPPPEPYAMVPNFAQTESFSEQLYHSTFLV